MRVTMLDPDSRLRYGADGLPKRLQPPPRLKDLAGRRFGRLVVQYFAGRNLDGDPVWLCQCDCGNKCARWGVRGLRSCGCVKGGKRADKPPHRTANHE
jgi:hypothetical protein